MTVKLGPFELSHPFILAPMAGITDSPFRRLMKKMGSSLLISELVSAEGIWRGGPKTLELVRFSDDERPIGIQIFGSDIEKLCRAAQFVEEIGADFVDINMGCPVPKIVKKGAGSALARDPVALGKLLTALVKSVHIPVSVKMRSGWDSLSRNAHECVRAASDAGVSWVAIHSRTRSQGYSGEADWQYLAEIKANSSIPVIGNGDLVTPEHACERFRTSKVDAVMIGRGALRNPFIFEQSLAHLSGQAYQKPAFDRYSLLLTDHRRFLEEAYSGRMALIQARKFLAWYASGFAGCHEFRRSVFTTTDPDLLWATARDFFEENFNKYGEMARADSLMYTPFLMGGHG